METDKEHYLVKEIRAVTWRIAFYEFNRIIADDDTDEYLAIEQIGKWQNKLMNLEKKYRKLKEE